MDWVETFDRRKPLSKGLTGIVKKVSPFWAMAQDTSAKVLAAVRQSDKITSRHEKGRSEGRPMSFV
jgi:hypothetical protein